MVKAACVMSGKCCERLVSKNTLDYVQAMRVKTQQERLEHNFTSEFMDMWESAALRAVEEGRQLFKCPALTGKKLCRLQIEGVKPSICSDSLSTDRFKTMGNVGHHNFFHHTCGYLNGAPNEIRVAVESSVHCYELRSRLPKDHPEVLKAETRHTKLCVKANKWEYCIKNGEWKTRRVHYGSYHFYKGKSKKWARRRNKILHTTDTNQKDKQYERIRG